MRVPWKKHEHSCRLLDLDEDAVAPEAKEAAREQILDALRTGDYGARELVALMRCRPLGAKMTLPLLLRWKQRRARTPCWLEDLNTRGYYSGCRLNARRYGFMDHD